MRSAVTENPLLKPAVPASGDFPWVPDQGDGYYCNPIIHADYPDPDVIRVGDDFWLTASSFNCTPGLPILHSRDLVNWTIVNHALKNVPGERYRDVQPGCGVWAPAIRFHAGRFWIFFPTPDEGIYVTTAADPRGQWSEPHLLQAGKGLIDPCPLWDDDGKAYLVHAYAGSRAGIKHRLRVCPMSPDGSRLLGEGKIVFHKPEKHPTLEGPKFLKRNGWYYILAPAGGVENGWQVALRSRDIYGPYEDKIVLEQGSTPVNGPHQGALLDTPNGQWWFIHFQHAGVYGRILHLQPVTWHEDWPLIGCDHDGNGIGEPVARFQKPAVGGHCPIAVPQTSDEFDSPALGPQWQWHANHRDDWASLTARKGWLRLYSQPVPDGDLAKTPNLLAQKFPAPSFTVDTEMEFEPASTGEEAGLAVVGRVYAALAVRRREQERQLVFRCKNEERFLQVVPGRTVKLRVQVKRGGLCTFSYALNGDDFIPVPGTFQAQAGVWIGAKVGLYALRTNPNKKGYADFACFRFSA